MNEGIQAAVSHIKEAIAKGPKPVSRPMFEPNAAIAFQRAMRRRSIKHVMPLVTK